ncbi:5026_t:CDS:2 [Ambispora gerdemannii]|uniref:5026_t:CDS:1 n=1 Tax=Ambispora gerdemannii TaxID=144530 RepID=A0A9N8WPS5_9GLOM|nr:5026_t:CDS:2 [Ambispora gerdemannii]
MPAVAAATGVSILKVLDDDYYNYGTQCLTTKQEGKRTEPRAPPRQSVVKLRKGEEFTSLVYEAGRRRRSSTSYSSDFGDIREGVCRLNRLV